MNTYKKSERLCHLRYKELLFSKGESFLLFPFRVSYLMLEQNLEPILFQSTVKVFEGIEAGRSPIRQRQNPSWPHLKLPERALFPYPSKCLIGVSKKNFRLAVKRNRIKRLVKEAYRKNKSAFYTFLEDRDQLCLLGLIYVAPSILPYDEIESKILLILQKLQEKIALAESAAKTQ